MRELDALADQQAELASLLEPLDEEGWQQPTRCDGWSVADVVLHLAQTNEMAIGSARGRYADALAALTADLPRDSGAAGSDRGGTVDDGADLMVRLQRGAPVDQLLARWRASSDGVHDAFRDGDPHARVDWVAGQLSLRTLTTTRLAETWIHTGDVAGALGVELVPADRLELIARLAWRTLPYAFARSGRTLHGPVTFDLTGVSGDDWLFEGGEPATTVVRGSGVELCAVAARRVAPAETGLSGDGPDVAAVLELVRTYA